VTMIQYDTGCKVAWEWYDDEDEARTRAADAAVERERKAALGYDFGYQWPGTVQHYPDHPVLGESWRVCIP
jgi:hypothetical protein